jgi:hypothetical protein
MRIDPTVRLDTTHHQENVGTPEVRLILEPALMQPQHAERNPDRTDGEPGGDIARV